MSRYERRIYFEWLVEKRAAYAALGDEDRTPIISDLRCHRLGRA